MRVLIDGTPLLVPGGGVKTHTFTWVCALLDQPEESVEFRLFPFLDRHRLPELNHLPESHALVATRLRAAFSHFVGREWNPAFGLLCGGAHVFHASHHIRALPRRAAITATVYDMTCWKLPEMHTRANVEATKWYAEHILRAGDGLVAISEHTRRDCAEVLRIPEGRISVIYPSVRDVFYDVSHEEARRAKRKFHLQKPYVLFLGCLEPRKNLRRLLEAWSLLRGKLSAQAELAVAGPAGWEDPAFLETLNRTPGVRRLGYIPVRDLPGVVKGAEALVYPSLYEGFGLPPAEAMAAGVPVVTSNTACLPEVTAGAAALADPKRPEEIAAAIECVLTDSSLRVKLAGRGRRRAEAFRRNVSIQKSLAFFRRFG